MKTNVEILASSYVAEAVIPVGEPSIHSIATKEMKELGHNGVVIQYKKIVCSCAKPEGLHYREVEPKVIGYTMYNVDQNGPPNTDSKTDRPLVCCFRNENPTTDGLLCTGDNALLRKPAFKRSPAWVRGKGLL